MSATEFAEAWQSVADVNGWLTRAQAQRLWTACAEVGPGGQVVEIGSFQGRSAIVAAQAATSGVEIVAIDPHAGNDRGPQQWEGTADQGQSDHDIFTTNLVAAGVKGQVRHVREFSNEAHPQVEGYIDLLYIDGAHRFSPARTDIVQWGARVAPGGRMLIHDAYSSVGVTLALFTSVVASPQWRYEGRSGSMVQYRRLPVSLSKRLGNIIRQCLPLGWFARNLVVKASMVLGWTPVARILGHDGRTWPY